MCKNIYRDQEIRNTLTHIDRNDQRIMQFWTRAIDLSNFINLRIGQINVRFNNHNQQIKQITLRLNNLEQTCNNLMIYFDTLHRDVAILNQRFNHVNYVLSLCEDFQRAEQGLLEQLNGNPNVQE